MKKAMVYLQSGGPTSVINSSLYGAIIEAKKHPNEIEGIYGSRYGIEGLLYDDLIDLGKEDEETIELFKQTPGSILGTTRHKLPGDIKHEEYEKICETVLKRNIGYVFVNGGNDSMDTCAKLSKLFKEKGIDTKVMGVPKTVDNDLAITDHCNGFGSAAKYVINTVQSICVDAMVYKKSKAYIIEVMGRNAGWMTAAVDMLPEGCRPDLIYLPENKFDLEGFLKESKEVFDRKGYVIIAISEGIVFERDTKNARVDSFGHMQLGGAAEDLAKIVESKLGLATRAIELSLPQRADPILISKVDQDETIACGQKAVQAALEGHSGEMVYVKRVSDKPYQSTLALADVNIVANAEKKVPVSMMKDHTRMDDSFREYLLPLIQGEVYPRFENGIYKTAVLKKIKVK